MRVFMCAALLAACDTGAARPYSPPVGPGIVPETSTGSSTGEAPRLDLGTEPPIPGLPSETGTTGEPGTTGEESTGTSTGTSTTDESSSGSTSTSTGAESTSTTSEASSSTGEPPAVCGDGVCEPSERAPCWGPKDAWCFGDCWKAPECKSDCPCTPEAAAAKNWCNADPLPACTPTAPGGYCSLPDGDVWGFYSWTSSCT